MNARAFRRLNGHDRRAGVLSVFALLLCAGTAVAQPAVPAGVVEQIDREITSGRMTPEEMENFRRSVKQYPTARPPGFGWGSAAAVPPDFPVPVFQGTDTRVLQLPQQSVFAQGDVQNFFQVQLTTRDPAAVVRQWYLKQLPASGFEVKSDSAGQAGGPVAVKARSRTIDCTVNINQTGSPEQPITLVSVNATRRQTEKEPLPPPGDGGSKKGKL